MVPARVMRWRAPLLAGLALLAAPRAALAKDPPEDYLTRNVVVLPFIGDDADKFEESVRDVVFSHKKMMKADADNLISTADKGGVPLSELRTGAGFSRFCPTLRIDAVVTGEVLADGKKWDLNLKVYDGETGSLLTSRDYPGLKSPKLEKKTSDAILKDIVKDSIRYAYAGPEAGKPRPPKKGDGDGDGAGDGDGDRGDGDGDGDKGDGDGDGDHGDGDGDRGDGSESGPTSRPAAGGAPWLEAGLGLGFAWHRVGVRSPDITGNPPFLAPTPFFAVGVHAAARPLALFLKGPPADIGVQFDFAYGFPSRKFCNSATSPCAAGDTVIIPNGWWELAAGAFYRLVLLDDRLDLRPRVGFRHFHAFIDPTIGSGRDLATFAYSSIRIGIDAAFTIVPKVRADAGLSYDLVLGVGNAADDFYGGPNTNAKSNGFEARLGGDYEVLPFLRVGGDAFLRYYASGFGMSANGTSGLTSVHASELSAGLLVVATYLMR